MPSGIVCKLWNIQGKTATRSAKIQLEDSIEYVENEEKTGEILSLSESAINDPLAQLGRECQYIENDIKTLKGVYIGGHNLVSPNVKDAVKEMMEVKEFYKKTDGRAALHGMISLPEEESAVENAPKLMQLCENVLKEIFPNNQAIFAIHTNTENLHVHFIVNSVGLNGKKIHQDNNFVKEVLHYVINKYAREYGFTENEKWKAEMPTKSVFAVTKMHLRKLVDEAIEQADSIEEFVSNLREAGVIVNAGKHISLELEGFGKAVRTHQLGVNYTKDAIIERIGARKAAFESVTVGTHVANANIADIYTPTLTKLKRYRDLNPEEKKRMVRLLRAGRNPWKEQQKMNWQLRQIANELNAVNRVSELTSFYSIDGTLSGALEGIIEAKKQIENEKKIINRQKRKYKPILDIYYEMKKIEKKAYLYEHEYKMEFRPEYERYRELTRRLKNGYAKEIDEVANFVNECEERLLYAHAQLKELSEEYREIKRYEKSRGTSVKYSERLSEMLDTREMWETSSKGIFETDVFYVVSNTSDVILRVMKLPEPDGRGRLKEIMRVTVLTRYGEKIDEFDSSANLAQFRRKINECEKQYGFTECTRFSKISAAREFLRNTTRASEKDKPLPVPDKEMPTSSGRKGYTFTQIINLKSVKGANGVHYISNRDNPAYLAIVMSNENEIDIRIVGRDGKIINDVRLPVLTESTSGGYLSIVQMQREYGFSDDMVAFDNLDEAKQYMDEHHENYTGRKELTHERPQL